ncbi:MAG: PKD domain-containing protein [Bacteroidales bacterium]|nr:PKD domain-containing protein [Bacteroidales bacterium]
MDKKKPFYIYKFILNIFFLLALNTFVFSQCPVTPNFNYIQYCDSVQFQDSSYVNGIGLITYWHWDFDDGDTSNLQNPSHTYSINNIYYVILTVTDSSGCDTSITKPVSVYLPASDFTFNIGCLHDTTFFIDESQHNADSLISWYWDFDDGGNSTLQNPSHIYNTADTFNVSLSVANNYGCFDTTSKNVIIDPLPQAGFFSDTVCFGIPTAFTDTSQGFGNTINYWLWNFGDPASGVNNTSTLQNPTHLFTESGVFNVKLIIKTKYGCSDSITKPVLVNPLPVANFTYLGTCLGNITHFFDNSNGSGSNIISWSWEFGDGNTSTSQNPSNLYNSPGIYNVKLIVENANLCVDDTIIDITIDSLPVADFIYTPACLGKKTYFTDISIPNADSITSWLWNIDGYINYTKQHIDHIFYEIGEHFVILSVINSNGCDDFKIDTIIVDYPPIANFHTDETCFKDSTYFTDDTQTQGVPIASWLWDFDDGNTSSEQDPVHLYSNPGIFYVDLTVENTHGCQDDITKPIMVDSLPEAEFGFQNVALGLPTPFQDESLPHGSPIVSRQWDLGDGNTSNNITFTHLYDSAGIYTVKLLIEDANGCRDSIHHYVLVSELPLANFVVDSTTYNLRIFFADSSKPSFGTIINQWYWEFGDTASTSNTSTSQNPSHKFTAPGYYDVSLTITDSNGGIEDTTKTIFVDFAIVALYNYDNVCYGYPTYFYDFSYGSVFVNIENWYWDFGDGDTLHYTEKIDTLTHLYDTSGVYTVELIISANYDEIQIYDTLTKDVIVHPTPTAYFDSTMAVCEGSNIYFKDLSHANGDTITAWLWDFGDNHTSTLKNPSHLYSTIGIYDVKLTVTNSCGCSDTIVQPVIVSSIPEADFEFYNACVDDPTFFIAIDSTQTIIDSCFW